MTNYRVKYIRWRKPEGQWPRWGPYMVVRRSLDTVEYFTQRRLDRPEINLGFSFGFYVADLLHFKLSLEFLYDEMYWEVW
jgi:hypothetical protein